MMENTVYEDIPMRNFKRNHIATTSVFDIGGFDAFSLSLSNELIFFRISMSESITEHTTFQG